MSGGWLEGWSIRKRYIRTRHRHCRRSRRCWFCWQTSAWLIYYSLGSLLHLLLKFDLSSMLLELLLVKSLRKIDSVTLSRFTVLLAFFHWCSSFVFLFFHLFLRNWWLFALILFINTTLSVWMYYLRLLIDNIAFGQLIFAFFTRPTVNLSLTWRSDLVCCWLSLWLPKDIRAFFPVTRTDVSRRCRE